MQLLYMYINVAIHKPTCRLYIGIFYFQLYFFHIRKIEIISKIN